MSRCTELTCPHHGPDNQQALVAYRGTMPAWEAPGEAIPIHCPVGDGCVWREYWDTTEEVRTAVLDHVRTVHGADDPIAAMKDAWWRDENARREAKRRWEYERG